MPPISDSPNPQWHMSPACDRDHAPRQRDLTPKPFPPKKITNTAPTMNIADRIARLGTETAFAVSAEAAAFAAKGNHVYPFHLGDMNLPTPSTVVEGAIKAIRNGKTGYCPNAGIQQLREALAADISASHGIPFTAENVAIQPGGKPVIGKFIQAVMNPGDEVLYPNPGYPSYESQIEYHGGTALPYGYIETGTGFTIDIDAIERSITPKTRILILNDLQNPIGAEASPAEFERLARCPRRPHRRRLRGPTDPRHPQGAPRHHRRCPQLDRRCTCARPEATFYVFPNVTGVMNTKGFADYDSFRKAALEATGVSFCTRHHFGRAVPGETERYIRFAYSGINTDQIGEGIASLKSFLEA